MPLTRPSIGYHVDVFLLLGSPAGGPWSSEGGADRHLAGGAASGLAGGVAWHFLNFQDHGSDLFWAGAALGATWGFVHGLLVWGIPDDLYAGWVRVLTWNRYSRRIPVDALQGGPQERFVGHFTRGLDLFLAPDDGVAEMPSPSRSTITIGTPSADSVELRRGFDASWKHRSCY